MKLINVDSPAVLDATQVSNPNLHRYTFHQLTVMAHGTIPAASRVRIYAKAKDSSYYEEIANGALIAANMPTTMRLPEWILDEIKVEGDAAFVAAGCTLTVIYSGYATAVR